MTAEGKLAILLGALDEALADLETYATEVPFERLVAYRNAFRMVCNALYVAGQAAIDIAELMLAQRRLGPAQSYREAFDLLARAGVIPPHLATDLGNWAGLRNVLAHIYSRLDMERIHLAYTRELEPLRAFRNLAAEVAG